ncbi:MAG: DUF4920 domain-containing protein [Candidatus Marinimicrobia bacterium]|nr:DUF4920 domain-containing protein [Candidatus Neomarinimicrobiota bacterium]
MFKQTIMLIVIVASLGMFSCSSDTAAVTGEAYGQELTLAEAIPVSDIFAKANDLNGQVVRVSGTVSDLCKHKGCWMQVSDGDQVMTVRFKDEAFTLPADAAGRRVDFEGLLIAEKIKKDSGLNSGCAEGGQHSGDAACESMRAEKTAQKATDMRYTMVSTGLILL